MDDVAVIHIDFPPNATVADVHRLFAENRPPPGQCNFNLTSNTFMPAPVVTAIMQIVHGPSDHALSMTFFEWDEVSMLHASRGEVCILLDSTVDSAIRFAQVRVLVACVSAVWSVHLICGQRCADSILCDTADLSRVVNIDITSKHTHPVSAAMPLHVVADRLVSLQHLGLRASLGTCSRFILDLADAVMQRCQTLERLALDWPMRGHDARRMAAIISARRAPLKIRLIVNDLDEGITRKEDTLLRRVAVMPNVSKLSIFCLERSVDFTCQIIDLLRGSTARIALEFPMLWTDAAAVRHVCNALVLGALNITSLLCGISLADADGVGRDMEKALAANRTLRKFSIFLSGRFHESALCDHLVAGMAQNVFIEKFDVCRVQPSAAAIRLSRQMMPTLEGAGMTYTSGNQNLCARLKYSIPWRKSHLVCEFVDGYAVQRAIDSAAAREAPRFLARMCDLSHGLPLMRGAMAEVTSISIHWCSLAL